MILTGSVIEIPILKNGNPVPVLELLTHIIVYSNAFELDFGKRSSRMPTCDIYDLGLKHSFAMKI